MKQRVEIRPIELDGEGNPLDPALYAFYTAFCEKEFGNVPDPRRTLKTWGAFVPREGGGYEACVGVISQQWQMVTNTCHITKPQSREDIPIVHAARDGLIARAKSFLQDNGVTGSHVYIAPEAQELWKGFIESLGGKSSNHFSIDV